MTKVGSALRRNVGWLKQSCYQSVAPSTVRWQSEVRFETCAILGHLLECALPLPTPRQSIWTPRAAFSAERLRRWHAQQFSISSCTQMVFRFLWSVDSDFRISVACFGILFIWHGFLSEVFRTAVEYVQHDKRKVNVSTGCLDVIVSDSQLFLADAFIPRGNRFESKITKIQWCLRRKQWAREAYPLYISKSQRI